MVTSVRTRIVLLLVGSIVVCSLLQAWVSYVAARRIIEQNAMRTVGVAAEARRHALVGKLLHQHERASSYLQEAERICESGDREQCLQTLRSLVVSEGATGARLIVPRWGSVTLEDMKGIEADDDPLGPEHLVRFAWAERQPYYLISKSSERSGASLVLRFEARNLAPIFLDRYALGESGESFLTDSQGIFLTPGRYSPSSFQSHPIRARPMELCLSGHNAELLDKDYRGVDIVHGFRYVPEAGGACIMAHLDQAEAFAPARELRDKALRTGLVFILIAVAFGVIMAHASVKPLRLLTEKTQALAADMFSGPVRVSGPTEVRELARSFNEMSASLEQSRTALRNLNAELEQRVTDRTGELAAANRQLSEQHARLQLLLDMTNALVSKPDVQELLRAISGAIRPLLEHDSILLYLRDPETGHLKVLVQGPETGEEVAGEELLFPETNDSPSGRVLASLRPLLVDRLEVNRFPSEETNWLVKTDVKSGCWIPLAGRRGIIGVLGLCAGEAAFAEKDLELLIPVGRQVSVAVENALAHQQIADLSERLAREKLYLEEEIRTESGFEEIVGNSRSLKVVQKQASTVAETNSTVLITGETGTGKELIARAIHNLSGRRQEAFVKLNCAAIPAGLLESELFGHEKGAFTGAVAQKVGRLEIAARGTLFLDEVGELPLETQPKLLRVLQERAFERLGSNRTIRVDVRLVAATNRDLQQMVAKGQFRDDLFYRLNVFPIQLPPLRERTEDIPLLVRHFVQKYAARLYKKIEMISSADLEALTKCPWPGNIRELENVIERSVILTRGETLEVPLGELRPEPGVLAPGTLTALEREHILRALQHADWVVGGPNGAAAVLGVKRTTLHAKMRKLGISREAV